MNKILIFFGLLLLPFHIIFASDIETEKIQWHLNRVEGILRQVDTGSLSKEQSMNRIIMLDRLHSYTEAGKFPNNDLFPGKSVPFFKGSNGNLCAVGYLMDADPEYKTFIENIIKTNNNIKIMDIQDNPVINTWAKKYGFSILELAMIQPSYIYMHMHNMITFGLKIIFFPLVFLCGALFMLIGYNIYTKNEDRTKKFSKYLIITLIISILYIHLINYYKVYF